jgi:hypothetical protein
MARLLKEGSENPRGYCRLRDKKGVCAMKDIIGYLFLGCVFTIIGAIVAVNTSSPGAAQNASAPAPKHVAPGNTEGRISDIVHVPGYTYAEVETETGKVWVAAPSISVNLGDNVSFSTNMPMHGFYSKSLQREFGVIFFVDRFILDDGATSISEEATAAHGRIGSKAKVQPVPDIRKAKGGFTIAEILARGDELSGETMRVRGQVTKVTANVMNTNWIRIQDSSTTEDLVATTGDEVAINDIVMIEGRLELNRDLGQGYLIPAILEDAKVLKE